MWWENLDLPKATPPNAGDSSNKVVSNDFPSVKEASESKKKNYGDFPKTGNNNVYVSTSTEQNKEKMEVSPKKTNTSVNQSKTAFSSNGYPSAKPSLTPSETDSHKFDFSDYEKLLSYFTDDNEKKKEEERQAEVERNYKEEEERKRKVEAKRKRQEEERKRQKEEERKRKERNSRIISVCIALVFVILSGAVAISYYWYNRAGNLMEQGEYYQAITIYEKSIWVDKKEKIKECHYNIGIELMNKGRFQEAFSELVAAGDFSDSEKRADEIVSEITTNESTISAGLWHTVALKSDGTVVAIGENESGQCDVGEWTDIVKITTGYFHTVGLRKDGTVIATGYNDYGQCDVSDWRDIVAISAGAHHTIGLKSDGTVVAVGDNDEGQCNVEHYSDVVAIEARLTGNIIYEKDGSVVGAGYDCECNFDDWSNIVAVSGSAYNVLGIRKNKTVLSACEAKNNRIDVSDWRDIVAISVGDYHIIGLKSDGTVVAEGNNDYGQCDVEAWKGIKLPLEPMANEPCPCGSGKKYKKCCG